MSRIGLGTVQFGADYGVSNHDGRPSEAEVAAILARAVEAGIGYLDTAASYANAETLIGRHLPPENQLRIVTKLPPVAEDAIAAAHAKTMLAALATSLERLRAAQVYGVLIHGARDLAKPGWQHLVDALQEARSRGLTVVSACLFMMRMILPWPRAALGRTSCNCRSMRSIVVLQFRVASRVCTHRESRYTRARYSCRVSC